MNTLTPTPIDWQPLREIIERNQNFLLSSHVRPDADALGSEMGMACILEQMGKTVRIVNPSHTPGHLDFLDPTKRVKKIGDDIQPAELADAQVHLIVDTSAWAQLADVGRYLKMANTTKAVIDHHVSNDDLGALLFKDPKSEATGSLIFRLGEYLGTKFTPAAATALYAAIATDTGWFRFAATNSDTMRIAGALIDLGAQPDAIYRQLYEQATLARLHLAGRALSRVTLECGGQLAFTFVRWQDFTELGAHPADTEDLVNECLKVTGTKAAFIAIEQMTQQVKISFRSRIDLNVAAVAEQFGGGGHRQAAGATLPGPFDTALQAGLTAMKSAIAAQIPPA